MNAPALNERVTVIKNGHVVHARVCGHPFKGSFQWCSEFFPRRGSVISGIVEVSDEHVTWLRGWTWENSVEEQALRAANALGFTQLVDLEENSRRFIAGEIDQAEWDRNVDLWDAQLMAGKLD